MTKAEFFKLMADNQLTVNFDDKLYSADNSEPGVTFWQEWSKEWIGHCKWQVGPNQETADRILKYWKHRRHIREELKSIVRLIPHAASSASNPA